MQNVYRTHFPQMVSHILMLGLSVFFLIGTSASLSLLIIPCFLSYYLVGPYLNRKALLYQKLVTQKRMEYNRKLYDSFTAMSELRAQSAESWDFARFEQKQNEMNGTHYRFMLFNTLRWLFRSMAIYAGALVMMIAGARLIQTGELTIGAFIAFTFYYSRVMLDMTSLLRNMIEQRMAIAQAERVYRFMLEQPAVEEPDNPVQLPAVSGELRFEHVCFQYDRGERILDGFQLTVRPGERIALVGQSGGGKSTLMKLIGRFYDPTDGVIKLDGVPISRLSFKQLREQIGIVFQETYLYGGSIRENIRFGNPEATDEQVEAAAEAAYAHDFIMSFPEGYETRVGERGVKLSGGQKQRIAIARMLIKNPTVVLLDEAMSALDNASEREVKLALQRLLAGKTVIAIAHRLSTIEDYDRIAVLDGGRIAEIGSYEELMRRRGLLVELVEGERKQEGEATCAAV